MDVEGVQQPGGTWPFVGRAAELEQGRRAIASQQGVVVFGGGGVGKSRLAVELLGADRGRWHQIVGSAGVATVAFGAWSQVLPRSWDGAVDDAAAWRALAEHLQAPDGSIHLAVDDAHWLDAGSAALLHHLVASYGATAVVTSRRDAPALQPVTALWKDGHLARIDLEPLPEATVAAVVEAALGGPVEPSTIARLHARTGGSPLVIRELVDDALRAGSLQLMHGAWIETTPTRPSPRLVDLLGDRIDGLAPEQRAAAEVLAVAAPLERQLATRVAPAAAIQGLVDEGLAHVQRDGLRSTVALADPIMGEVLLERLDAGRRDDILGRVVDQLGQSPDLDDDDVVRLVAWQIDLGRAIDPSTALHAADVADGRSDFTTAERLAAAAEAAGAGAPATIRVGEALAHQQRQAEADDVLRPIGEQLEDLDDDLRFRYGEARAFALARDLGRLDDAIEVLEKTIETMADDRSRWRLEAHLSFLLADCGRLAAASPLAEARLANIDQDEVSALSAFVACGLIRTYSGRCQDTLDLCERMMPIALRHLDERPEAISWIVAAQMLATYVRGDFGATLQLIEGMQLLTADEPDPTVRAGLLMAHGLLLSEQGRLETALRLLRQAAALHEVDNRRGYQAWCFAITSRVHALRGDLPAAQESLAAARRRLWPGGQSFAGDIDVAAIWVATLSGDRAEANRILDEGLDRAEREGMTTRALRLRHEAIRAGLPVEPHVEAFATTDITEQSLWARAEVSHVAALADDDGAALVAAGNELAGIGLHLEAAESYAQGAGAHRRAGSSALAAQAKQLGEAQRARCESAATPALRFGELVVGLTDRELDVTTRAAAGQTNQEIAAALGISVRTAETHLQRAFAKLGIHRRGELAAVFGPPGPPGLAM
ncbi:MAG TPA: helix-turn-helix transcriptional regulator [Acidimicrobiales bacterium]|nr:helix-turn-helix transcriptional regulator [Acidimicrobiales bacterium]